jgi:hypothetical protein
MLGDSGVLGQEHDFMNSRRSEHDPAQRVNGGFRNMNAHKEPYTSCDESAADVRLAVLNAATDFR